MRGPLRQCEAPMFDELLRTSHRRALHRQVRAERARQCVDAGRHLGSLGCVATRGQMPCRVVGVPSSVQSTRRLRRCRCWRSAIANRSVEGIGEDLEGFWDPAEAERGPHSHWPVESHRPTATRLAVVRRWRADVASVRLGPVKRPCSRSAADQSPERLCPPGDLRLQFLANPYWEPPADWRADFVRLSERRK